MRRICALAAVGIVAAVSTACSSGAATTSLPAERSSSNVPSAALSAPATPGAGSTQAAAVASGGEFCAAARRIGLRNVSPADSPDGADPTALLKGIDQLAALAPERIRGDLNVFDQFEHAVLGAQNGQPPDFNKLNDPGLARAAEHIGAYLSESCGISR